MKSAITLLVYNLINNSNKYNTVKLQFSCAAQRHSTVFI